MNRNMKLLVAMMTLLAVSAWAIDPQDAGLWHEPDRTGHGVLLEYNAGAGEFAVLWFTHHHGEPTWFISEDNCEAGHDCAVVLLQPSAGWLGGNFDPGGQVGTLVLERVDGGLRAEWDFIGLERCQGIGPGGLLLRRCVGKVTLEQLTSPRDP